MHDLNTWSPLRNEWFNEVAYHRMYLDEAAFFSCLVEYVDEILRPPNEGEEGVFN